eukprot:m.28118 g.28118  ORF g.28118 m.28118 type:complete len:69 (+) comp30575_c0_seq2:480-686(+)
MGSAISVVILCLASMVEDGICLTLTDFSCKYTDERSALLFCTSLILGVQGLRCNQTSSSHCDSNLVEE